MPHTSAIALTVQIAGTLATAAATSFLGGAPDLFISNAFLEDPQADPGDRVTIEYTIFNGGSGDVDDPAVGYYISSDDTLSGDDVLIDTENLGDLDKGESEDESEQFAIPSVSDGQYFIIIAADPFDAVFESDETNNEFALPITIGDGQSDERADLTIPSATLGSETAAPGDSVALDYTLVNDGAGVAEGPAVGYYLSTDATRSDDDDLIDLAEFADLAGGGSDAELAEITIPIADDGEYFVLVSADPLDSVDETDETNNTAALPITIGSGSTGCAADLNGDSIADLDDVQLFVEWFTDGDLSADFSGDGVLDLDDVQAFVSALNAGCP